MWLAQSINWGLGLIIDLPDYTRELSVLRDGHKIYKTIKKSSRQALGKHLDSCPHFPSETLCFSAQPCGNQISFKIREHLCLPPIAPSAAPHQTRGPACGPESGLSGVPVHARLWPSWGCRAARAIQELPRSKESLSQFSTPSILGLPSACCFNGMPFPFIGKGGFLHYSSCKKILSKKCIHASVPLAGPLSKQSSAFCVAAEVKSQLAMGSKSHRASGHACGHPREKHPMFGQIRLSQCCCMTSLRIHPHQETVCPTLRRTAPTLARLTWRFHSKAMRSAQHWILLSQTGHEQREQVTGGHDKAFQGQRSGSLDPSPGYCALSHSRWRSEDTTLWVTLPRMVSYTSENNTVGQSLAFSTA